MKVLFAIIGAIVALPILIALTAGISIAVLGGMISLFADLFVWVVTAALVIIGIVWLVKTIL